MVTGEIRPHFLLLVLCLIQTYVFHEKAYLLLVTPFSWITLGYYAYLSYAQFCFVYIFITYKSKDLVISENIVDGIKNRITSKVEHPH